ncbi:ATP-binding protein (plasmid) [Rhizobium sp. CB3090]|uniref:slr1658 superfamily regulator n=1 Tax=Rhizobium sp. CB3090 TaxID=3039156 RepID=UPI0024B0ABD1|nr:ATP-binding protein [Rhizobium sp. CB3090]WFU11248.1 ATP-binding protein [Rhizobium sp. CB3090]
MATVVFGLADIVAEGSGAGAIFLRLLDGPLALSWSHCSMTSDFIAEITALRYRSLRQVYHQVRHDIGYVANELIENAVKFRVSGEIGISASIVGERFRMRVSNFIDNENAARFQHLLAQITNDDPSDLLIQQIEKNAALTFGTESGLGLLTLMSDYEAELAWTFDANRPNGPTHLETYASLPIPSVQDR